MQGENPWEIFNESRKRGNAISTSTSNPARAPFFQTVDGFPGFASSRRGSIRTNAVAIETSPARNCPDTLRFVRALWLDRRSPRENVGQLARALPIGLHHQSG